MKKHSKHQTLKSVLRFSVLILCGAVLGFNIYFANANSLLGNQLPMPFGYGAAVVLSGSMEPELSKGDLIIVKETDDVAVKEVVVYQDGNSLVVHRIIDIKDQEITTKGDANNTADAPITKADIKGEVVCAIPFVGSVVQGMKTPVGIIVAVALAIFLLEAPRIREKQKDTDELEAIKAEIRKLKYENEQ